MGNNNSGEPLDTEGYYLEVLQAPTSSNEFVGYAVYYDCREDTRDYIKFWPNEDRTGYTCEEDIFTILPQMSAEGSLTGLQLQYFDGHVFNFALEAEYTPEWYDVELGVSLSEVVGCNGLEIVSC